MSYLTLYPFSQFDAALPSLCSLSFAAKQSLIEAAFETIHTFLGWGGETLVETRYKEQLDGLNGPTIQVTKAPITTIHNVWLDINRIFNEDEPETSDTEYLVEPDQYRIDRSKWGILRTRNIAQASNPSFTGWPGFSAGGATGRLNAGHYGWPNGKGIVWADYTGGFTAATMPGAIRAAMKELIAYSHLILSRGGLIESSVHYQDVTRSYSLVAQAFQTDGSMSNARNLLNKTNLIRPVSYAIPAYP